MVIVSSFRRQRRTIIDHRWVEKFKIRICVNKLHRRIELIKFGQAFLHPDIVEHNSRILEFNFQRFYKILHSPLWPLTKLIIVFPFFSSSLMAASSGGTMRGQNSTMRGHNDKTTMNDNEETMRVRMRRFMT